MLDELFIRGGPVLFLLFLLTFLIFIILVNKYSFLYFDRDIWLNKKFKEFVKEKRPILDLDAVATGEHWLGIQAFDLKLVDELRTSDDYLMSLRDAADIFEVEYSIKKKVLDRLSGIVGAIRGPKLPLDSFDSFTQMK